MQVEPEGWEKPVICDSLTFTCAESWYSDQPRLELCGVANILNKMQTVLWGQHFELQVDALPLV